LVDDFFREIEPAERVVRSGVVGATVHDQRADAVLDEADPAQ